MVHKQGITHEKAQVCKSLACSCKEKEASVTGVWRARRRRDVVGEKDHVQMVQSLGPH